MGRFGRARGPGEGRRFREAALLTAVAFVVAAGSASVVAELRSHQSVQLSRALPPGEPGEIPGAGAYVPAYDLSSDPVFPTLSVGYAIESHTTSAGTSEHLARSLDGGRRWYLAGASFPFAGGYSEVQFFSVEDGYAFGPAGLAVTENGGKSWQPGGDLGGTLERVVPIGRDVWATYALCHGPPEATTPCQVHLAISTNEGLSWKTAGRTSPLTEAMGGGDILARYSLDEAFVVSYGPTGGGLAVTYDSGRRWTSLPDPCAAWQRVDLAVLNHGQAWMICGGQPTLSGAASPKAVLRSFDYGRRWTLEASTGFGPALAPVTNPATGVVGRLPFEGQLSQLATISPVRAWIGVSGLGVLVSTDSGRAWSLVEGMGPDGRQSGVGVTFDDARHGWAIEFNEGVWRTTDAVHWSLIDGR